MRGLACAGFVLGLLVSGDQSAAVQAQSDKRTPTWVDGVGHPTGDAREALTLLRGAADEGLDPDDYRSASLDASASALDRQAAPSPSDASGFDAALTDAMVRYLQDLHEGRVDPRAAGFLLDIPPDHHDFAAIVRDAAARHRLRETVVEFTPPLPLYAALRTKLAEYRRLAADPSLSALPAFTTTLHPGDSYTDAEILARRLRALGDLEPDASPTWTSSLYEGALVDAVKRFQLRHGLEVDGIVGKGTQTALRTPLTARVREIELALERLRWLPHLDQKRLVVVNIPMFRLWAWDAIPADGVPSFNMGVIVGRAVSRQTPVFVDEMESVIFRPYWNVPASIVRHEILPAVARDSEYLRRHDMEIVSGQGDDARRVTETPESLVQLREGRLRLRQIPGPDNALGLVKFVFPNDENVYMHATPAMQLFSRSRRDFSHGCVRLEDPVALAEWALNDQPEWTRDRILAAMNGDKTFSVPLRRPIQVVLFYTTAIITSAADVIRFADDIYGHDARLERALSRARRSPAAGAETRLP